MTLHMIGLGLCDGRDITMKGLERLKQCKTVYLEYYTSLLQCSVEDLEKQLDTPVTLADRDAVEQGGDRIVEAAKHDDVALLIVGDVFGATTHLDIYMRAKERGVNVTVTFNASIINAVGIVGLELYKYGQTTSIPYFTGSYRPTTPLSVIEKNLKTGLHTLCLLDINPPRFMSVNEAIDELFEMQRIEGKEILTENTLAVGCARIGCDDFKIVASALSDIRTVEFGKPLHSLIFPGKLHFMEEEALNKWKKETKK